jgi:hypothetical protein
MLLIGRFYINKVFTYNDLRTVLIFKIIPLSHVRFEFYNLALNHQNTINTHRTSWSSGRHSCFLSRRSCFKYRLPWLSSYYSPQYPHDSFGPHHFRASNYKFVEFVINYNNSTLYSVITLSVLKGTVSTQHTWVLRRWLSSGTWCHIVW